MSARPIFTFRKALGAAAIDGPRWYATAEPISGGFRFSAEIFARPGAVFDVLVHRADGRVVSRDRAASLALAKQLACAAAAAAAREGGSR